jgi:hypothetical protein
MAAMFDKLFDDLYEIFGFLLPGIPGLLGILTLSCTQSTCKLAETVAGQSLALWTCVGIAAYFLGHFFEGVAKIVYGCSSRAHSERAGGAVWKFSCLLPS